MTPDINDLTSAEFAALIEDYFNGTDLNMPSREKANGKQAAAKEKLVTFSGLASHLGFESRDAFAAYEQHGLFAPMLKRARLRIEAVYEKKLHHQSSSGAIFALKSWGWGEKPQDKTTDETLPQILTVKIIETGPEPASTEQAVDMA